MELSACGLCQLQTPPHHISPIDLPLYHAQTDSLRPTPKKLCKSCLSLISQIQQFAAHYQIKYCDSHFKSTAADSLKPVVPNPRHSTQLLFSLTPGSSGQRSKPTPENKSTTLPKRLSVEQPKVERETQDIAHPYIGLLLEEVKNKNLLCLSYLPKTLQLLMQHSVPEKSKQIVSPEQRRQRIKNIILFLAEKVHLNMEQAPYAVVLAHFLLCLMDPPRATAIIVRLSDIMLLYPNVISWKTIILDPDMHEAKNPQSPASLDMKNALLRVDKMWLRLQSVLQLSKRGESVLQEGTIRVGKISIEPYKEYRKKLVQTLKPLLSKRQQRQDKTDDKLTLLYHMKLERNSFSMIIRNMLEYEDDVKQQIAYIQNKHKKEKDQYIDKIIGLNNHIDELEGRICKMGKFQDKVEGFLVSDVEINAFDHLHIQDSQKNKVSEEPSQKEHVLNPQEEEESHRGGPDIMLQTVLTLSNLIGFNQNHLGSHQKNLNFDSSDKLMEVAIEEIDKLQQSFKKLTAKLKQAEDEKTRLLGIVSRKDDRFISVITEKDVIIERYEKALWQMENGLEVEQEPLAHRIRYIKHIIAKKYKKMLEQNNEESSEEASREDPKESKDKKQCQIY